MDRRVRGEYQAKQKDEDDLALKRTAPPSNKSLPAKLMLRPRELADQPAKKFELPCTRSERQLLVDLQFQGPLAGGVFFREKT
jgi:hypothetical protein